MKQSDLNHLRRLLGWIRCDIGQSPGELQQTMIDVADGLGHPEISEEARARMVEAYRRAESVPLYVRAAVKALEKALSKLRTEGMQADAAAADTTLPDVLPELTTDGGVQYVSMATMQAVLRAARAMLHAPIAGEEQKPVAVPDAIRVERVPQTDGGSLWAVRRNGDCLGRNGTWSYEPLPSSRSDAWLALHRFVTATAAIDAALAAQVPQQGEA